MVEREANRELICHLLKRFGPYRCNDDPPRGGSAAGIDVGRRTLDKLIEGIKPGTLVALADYFTDRLDPRKTRADSGESQEQTAGVGGGSANVITPEMLRVGFPGPFPDGLGCEQYALVPPQAEQAATAAMPPSCQVFPSQYEAEFEFFKHFGRIPQGATATLVDFSCHVVRPFIQSVLRGSTISRLHVLMGTADTAREIGSERQAWLIDNHKLSEFETDLLPGGRVTLTQFASPPTFRGFHVEGFVVCVGWYFWFPLCQDLDGDNPEVRQLLGDLARHGITPPQIADSHTLNGHDMPHVVAFRPAEDDGNSTYATLSRVFDLHARVAREHARLHAAQSTGSAAGNAPPAPSTARPRRPGRPKG